MVDTVENYDVVIVGAGPAGLGAASNAAAHKLSFILIEKREIGNTIFDYQLGKHVMAEPARLPLRGTVPFSPGSREAVLDGWNQSVRRSSINLVRGEVTRITKSGDFFDTVTSAGAYRSKHVILAIGVQGTPRKLGVPGEDMPHIAYTLADPGAHLDKDIIIVGAGDAAIENALALCERNSVSIVNRSAEFPRAKDANVAKITEAIRKGKIRLFTNASVNRIEHNTTYLNTPDGEVSVKCSFIIARLGGILPRKFLESCGIQFPNEDPAAVPVVSSRYESNVPGLFILGALIGYPLIKHALNQGFEVIEHILGHKVEPADQELIDEVLKIIPGDSNSSLGLIRKSLPLFKDLSEPQFRELILDSKIHSTKPQQIIFERNEYTDTFWSIISGSVSIELEGGKNIVLGSGDFFGELGLLSGRRRNATVRCYSDAILLESPRKQLLKLNSSVSTVKRALDEAFMLRALSSTIFPDADPTFLRSIVARAKIRNLKKGEYIFREGDNGDAAYVIRKGSVKVSRKNHRGVDVSHTYISAGNLVGEMALLSLGKGVRNASVSAAVACELILLEKEDFLSILASFPKVRESIERLAAARAVENITTAQNLKRGQLLDFAVAQGITDADNVLVIDSNLCIACDNCEKACAATHHGYSRLDRKGGQSLANIQVPISCRHCENPLCMLDCPPDALRRMPDGEVVIQDSCIGCGNCVRNCPYGVIQLVYDSAPSGFSLARFLGFSKPEKGPAKAAKCDMCSSLAGGPACVRSCPTGAAIRTTPRRLLALLADSPNNPNNAQNEPKNV